MIMNLTAREIVIDGDDCVEHTASPFFFAVFFARNIFFNRLEFALEKWPYAKYGGITDRLRPNAVITFIFLNGGCLRKAGKL